MASDHHQRAATAICVAACDLNQALADAARAGLVVEVATLGNAETPSVPRVVCRALLPVPATASG